MPSFLFCAALCAMLSSVLPGGTAAADPASSRPAATRPGNEAVPLLDDPDFQRGFKVFDPAPGRHVLKGLLRVDPSRGAPAWSLVQWSSRFTLAGAAPHPLESGAVRFADGAKAVTIGPPRGPERGLVLALNGLREYGPRLRRPDEPWAHILAEQRFTEHPSLAELAEVRFRIACRLLHCHAYPAPPAAQAGQAAQFLAYLTVQNLNRHSGGFGDYFWFGIQMYDSRYRIPKPHAALDKGTGKFIYNPPGSVYTDHTAHTGEWITIECDLLPLIREGLEVAWQAGYLKNSRDLCDLRLGGFNIGWELPGTLDVAMHLRDLRLEVVRRAEATSCDSFDGPAGRRQSRTN